MPRDRVKKQYSNYNPLFVYSEEYHQLTFDEIEELRKDQLYEWELMQCGIRCHYATKEIYAGEMLEVKIYPCFLGRNDFSKAKSIERTNKRQKALNDRYAREKLVRYVNANFIAGDYSFTVGYTDENQPESIKACKKDINKLVRRIKYHMELAGENPKNLKYLYVIERKEKTKGTHYHVHFLFSANAGSNNKGEDKRNFLEKLWNGGAYPQTRQLMIKESGGLTGISTYITEQFEELTDTEPNNRRWGASTNLKKHDKVRKTFRKFNRRKVSEVVKAPAVLQELLEKEYPEYSYVLEYPAEIKYNKEIDGHYIYCRMYKKKQYKPRN